jgi:DNA modification methylase
MTTPWTRHVKIGDCDLYLGDCLEVMPALGKVDACLTDPPYGIARENLKAGKTGEWSKLYSEQITWDDFAPQDCVEMAMEKSGGIAIIWGGNYFTLPPMRGWLIWDKMQWHTSGHAELAWTSCDIPIRDFKYSRAQLASEKKQHPTQKPVALMEWCLGFLPNAETILDPFMGSGTTLVACAKLGRKGIGIELDPDYFEIACKRVQAAYDQPDLFVAPPTPATQDGFDI